MYMFFKYSYFLFSIVHTYMYIYHSISTEMIIPIRLMKPFKRFSLYILCSTPDYFI